MKMNPIERHFFFAFLAIVTIGAIAIFYPFLTVLVLAAVFAVVLNPVHMFIKRNIAGDVSWVASLITVLLFTILLCGPLFFIGIIIFDQAQNAYIYLTGISDRNILIDSIGNSINHILPNEFAIDIHSKVNELVMFLSSHLTGFFTATLKTILLFFLMLVTIFYLLKDGVRWKRDFIHLLPLSESNLTEIFSKLTDSINSILKGSFFIAIIQGVLTAVGFAIFGVPQPALWGMTAGMASFMPTVGTALVSVPAVIFLFSTGMTWQAIGLAIWSIVFIGLIDNVLTPYIIGKNTAIPSFFILFSILGGIALMGAVGAIIGPLVLSLLYSLIAIYRKENQL